MPWQDAPRETGGAVTCPAGAGQTAAAPLDPHTIDQALALRAFVPDGTLLDWLDLERLLGYTSIQSTRRYAHLVEDAARVAVARIEREVGV